MERVDCVIVGGGIAGLQAAIQMGRYEHRVLVVDHGDGRSVLCRQYHNILGWPDGVSGPELRTMGRRQAEALGVRFLDDKVVRAERVGDSRFQVYGRSGGANPLCEADTVLLATGLVDRIPPLEGLVPCLGLTVYVCPDCDGYEVRQRRTIVMGAGDVGARMALLLRERTETILYVNHECAPVAEPLEKELASRNIPHIRKAVKRVEAEGDGRISGVVLEDGQQLKAERGFIAFGGNEVRSQLAHQLGVERHENGHILTDPRTKMTSVPGVWAAGDIGVHAEQVTIAMGEGMQAAIWMHKRLAAREPSLV